MRVAVVLPVLAVPAGAGAATRVQQTSKTAKTARTSTTKSSATKGNGGVTPGGPTTSAKSSGASGGSSSTGAPAPSARGAFGHRALKQGMHGHDVRVLQDYLSIVGYTTEIDGDFGPETAANVRLFQQSMSLASTGVVSKALAKTIRSQVALAEKATNVPVSKAHINPDGTVTPPASAPLAVQKMILAANKIIDKPYIYGGGHATWNDSGYDCSGAVSFVLHGANMLSAPEDSTELESYGLGGRGHWVTIYADSAHTWIVIAGLAFDTADWGGPDIPSGSGPRWRTAPTGNLKDGGDYIVRHPADL